jgi:putative ABC transport system permease protein
MIISSLVSRPVRTLVSILAVALEVTLILVIVGLTTGILAESNSRMVGVGADIMLQPQNSSMFLGLSSAPMPVSIGSKIAAEVPGVKAVTPVLTQTNSDGGIETVWGIEPATFTAIGGPFNWLHGGLFVDNHDVVVDDIYAATKKVSVGNEVSILNQKFRVAGVVEHGRGARVYLPLQAAQEMTGATNRASVFFIKTNSDQDVEPVLAKLSVMLEGYRLTRMRDLVSLMSTNNIPGLNAFIQTVVFIAVCVGVLVIFLSMYTTITERTREIGILRSLGASKGYVLRLIFLESFMICILGVGFGLIASRVVKGFVIMVFPSLTVMFTPAWIFKASLFAILSGLIGSFYPSLKAAAQDPIEALAYE